MSRPVALVDVDGVLADFSCAILDRVFVRTGVQLEVSSIVTWGIFDSPAVAAVAERHPGLVRDCFDDMREPGACLDIPVIGGAQEGIAALREVADVFIVTAPLMSDFWHREREQWLAQHFGFTVREIVHAHRKELVRGDLLVDDKPEHVNAWAGANACGAAVLWGTHHNGGAELHARAERTRSWERVVDIAKGVAQ